MDNTRPTIYQGKTIPFGSLEADPFADFIFSCLVKIQSTLNVVMEGKPTGTNDKGFDAWGRVFETGKNVCFQVKRYNSVKLSLSLVGSELCKVALTSSLEESDVSQHYIITSGKVEQKVNSAIRNTDRKVLVEYALKELTTENFRVKKKKLEQKGCDPVSIVESYVRQLEKIIVWDSSTFDAIVATHWQEILEIVDRYFQVQTVLRDNPRPNFVKLSYLEKHAKTDLLDLFNFGNTEDVPNIRRQSATSPIPQKKSLPVNVKKIDDLVQFPGGNVAIITGAGGTGKTSVLNLLQSKLCKRILSGSDDYLPIVLSLNGLDTNIDQAIHNVLEITYGHWKSLSGKLILLIDGLNEIEPSIAKTILDQINKLLHNEKLSVLLTVRNSGVRKPLVIERLLQTIKLYPIGPRQVRMLTQANLPEELVEDFLPQYRTHADRYGSYYLWTPFATLTAIKCFKEARELPGSMCELLEKIFSQQLERNEELFDTLSDEIQLIPLKSVVELCRNVAFQMQIKHKTLSLSSESISIVLKEAISMSNTALGIERLDTISALSLLSAYELLVPIGENYSFRHEIITGFLAAQRFAEEWQSHEECLESTVADDTLLFAGYYLSDDEVESYLQFIANKDLILAARTARESGHKHQTAIETIIYKQFDSTDSDLKRRICTIALGFVGSESAMGALRKLAQTNDRNIAFLAKRALASCGELKLLKELQPQIEKERSAGVNISGGILPIWDAAPQWIRLKLARERIGTVATNQPLCDSLDHLADDGDESDIDSIKKCIAEAPSLPQLSHALFALYCINSKTALEVIEDLFEKSSVNDRSKILALAANFGEPLHIEWAVNYVCGDYADTKLITEESKQNTLFSIYEINRHLLNKYPLSTKAIERLIMKIQHVPVDDFTVHAWSIVASQGLEEVYDLAKSELLRQGEFMYYACLYFENFNIRQNDSSMILESVSVYLENPKLWFQINARYALRLLAHYKHLELAESSLLKMQDLIATEQKSILEEKTKKSDSEVFSLGTKLCEIIDYLAVFKHKILTENKLLLLTIESSMYEIENQLISLIDGISSEEVDTVLSIDFNPLHRARNLKILSSLGSTDTRLETCRELLSQALTWPILMNELLATIKNLWSDSVVQIVCSVVFKMKDWGTSGTQFVKPLTDLMANNLSSDQATQIVYPLIEKTVNEDSREILKYWYDSITIIRK